MKAIERVWDGAVTAFDNFWRQDYMWYALGGTVLFLLILFFYS